MVHTLHRLREFLRYQQRAQTKYYIHSPFVYQFYLHILEGNESQEAQNIKELHRELLQTYDKISIDDMGAEPGTKVKTISQLAAKASVPDKYGKVLFNIVRHFEPRNIIELGTCLGMGTAWMAGAFPPAKIISIEGSKQLAENAAQNFNLLGLKNIAQVLGNFDEKLPEVLTNLSAVDLAFIDGNHRYEPTMQYFHLLMQKAHEKTVLVFDDICWSPEMSQAWTAIKRDPRITLSVDIYRFGIVFMHKDKLAKEDFVLRY